MQNKNNNNKRGYTIIETMIAVALFIIVVMAGMGSLLNANLLHAKSQSMRSILDNLSFVMEDMSRNLRTGYDYHCIDDGDTNTTTPHSCASGAGISFKSTQGGGQWVYYLGTVAGCDGKNNGVCKKVGTDTVQLVPSEISLKSGSGFSVLGAETQATGNEQQPLVMIRLVGEITIKGATTPFSLQTTVSQRKLDI